MSAAPGADYWATLPLRRDVALITRDDNGLAAFAKPPGVLSHPNGTEDEARALLTTRYYKEEGEFFEWRTEGGETRRLWLLNRLDSATSGVILAAATEALATEIRAQFKRKQVRKVYHAVVFGAPRQPLELWRDLLAVDKSGGKIRTATSAGHVPAESRMTLIRASHGQPRLALIKLEPKTGRSHQLRVQCAKRHLPIVGDQTYGDFKANRALAKETGCKRLCLHSSETSFDYEFGGKLHRFAAHAELPPEFAELAK